MRAKWSVGSAYIPWIFMAIPHTGQGKICLAFNISYGSSCNMLGRVITWSQQCLRIRIKQSMNRFYSSYCCLTIRQMLCQPRKYVTQGLLAFGFDLIQIVETFLY